MTSNQHHKHAKLARPASGSYCRNEWAILGTTCDVIQQIAAEVIKDLSPTYKAAYLDATHKEEMDEPVGKSLIEYTSHPSGEQLQFNKKFSAFTFREIFNEADFALVNGNHLKAKAQVVIIDQVKKSSLQKRIADLTDVQLIILKNDGVEMFDFIKALLPEPLEIPVYQLSERGKIAAFFKNKMELALPPLHALVLAGGKSVRMGHDKTGIRWHGKEQRYHVADMLSGFCKDVFISCRADQLDNIDRSYNTLVDTFTDLGPYGAILSAFRANPNVAWLIIASDLPLLDQRSIEQLVSSRNPASVATTFIGLDGQPEPLITIWEPKSYFLLLAQLAQGYSCPRKLLMNNDVQLLSAADAHALMNVNTPEEAAAAKQWLETKLSKA